MLTCRVAYLILEKKLDPSHILVITFTRKAKQELKERLIALVGKACTELLRIDTFHSACVKILRRHGLHFGIKPNFEIINERRYS